MSVFFVVPSRDSEGLEEKIDELTCLGYPFVARALREQTEKTMLL
jgi:hypothetical protein